MAGGLPWVWTPEYEVDIGAHVFPTVKYRLTRDRLLEEGTLEPTALHPPPQASRPELARVHSRSWLEKVFAGTLTRDEERTLEVPYSPELLRAFLLCCGGTTLAGRRALEHGVASHLGGGFHHAFADHGEGFCLLNDVAVAAATLRAEGHVRRVTVLDLDVHHGNGTAAIFQDEPAVFTFSMHQEANYPFVKPPGDLDVPLPDGMGDERYLALLEEHLPTALEWEEGTAELAFYLAGADPYRQDQLGGLALSLDGLRRRDRLVLAACRERSIPVVTLTAGGYAFRRDDTVEIHCNTIREALDAL
jgi:acetoin utilization deacetylase AcuC-like enzyme